MHGYNITPFLRWSFPASHSRRMVLCLPVNVAVCIVLSVVVCPGVVLYKGARAPGVRVAGWDWAAAIFLTEAVRIGTGMTAVPPAVAVSTVAVLGAGGSKMPHLVAGIAARPGLQVSWAIGMDMAHITTHGTKVIHVDDWGSRGDRWGVPQCRGAWGVVDSDGHGVTHVSDWGGGRTEGELDERSGGDSVLDQGDIDGQRGRGVDGVGGGGLSRTLIRSVVRLPADGTGRRGGFALSLVLLLVLSSVRWDRNGAR